MLTSSLNHDTSELRDYTDAVWRFNVARCAATIRWPAIPPIMLKSHFWTDTILPTVLDNTAPDSQYHQIAAEIRDGLCNGWRYGDNTPKDKVLNQKNQNWTTMGIQKQWYIMEEICTESRFGAVLTWPFRHVQCVLPIFIKFERFDKITGQVTKFRAIRNASKGTDRHPSLNAGIPDQCANIKLVGQPHLQRQVAIMAQLWGPRITFAKGDLERAFRQFPMNDSEFPKVIYKVQKLAFTDIRNVWGTRSGSRICQNATQMYARYCTIISNGTHLIEHIDMAIEQANYIFFYNLLNEPNPQLHDQAHGWNPQQIWSWGPITVQRWIKDAKCQHIDILSTIQNGRQLIKFHIGYALKCCTQSQINQLQQAQFFDKLIHLKLSSNRVLKALINAYIDDFILILSPSLQSANKIFENFTNGFDAAGMLEKKGKRVWPTLQLDLLGVDYDATDITTQIMPCKRQWLIDNIQRYLWLGYISASELETMIGKLQYVANLAWPGKAFLRRLREALGHAQRNGRKGTKIIVLDNWTRKDFEWWLKYINVVHRIPILQLLRPDLPEHRIYLDGATNGCRHGNTKGVRWRPAIGAFTRGHYIKELVPDTYLKQFRARGAYDNYRSRDTDYAIPHFEMLAAIRALQMWAINDAIAINTRVLIYTDNMWVLNAIKNKNTKDEFLMSAVRWILMWAVTRGTQIYIQYVNTKVNVEADSLSRFDMKKFLEAAQPKCQLNGWTLRETHCNDVPYPDIYKW